MAATGCGRCNGAGVGRDDGRDPGRPEFVQASDYVAHSFARAGLRPGGTNGFFQPVPLSGYRVAGPGAASWQPAGGAATPLRPGIDFNAEADPCAPSRHVSAPVVFVGYGIAAPHLDHDDYRGADVRGKIVAMLFGGPAKGDPFDRALLWDMAEKRRTALARGAVGVIGVHVDRPGNASFATTVATARYSQTTWIAANGDSGAGPASFPMLATMSEAGATTVFGPGWKDASRPIAAAGRLTIDTATEILSAPSRNVAAILPGSDARLSSQVVVVSAHLDHLGVAPTGEGDRIDNGALDNAMGVSVMLDIARRLAADRVRPRRSILFLATTGEEAGMLGSDYFAGHPPLARARLVANVNIDMPILTYPFRDIIVFGAPYSTLIDPIRITARDFGVRVSPDPEPDLAYFARSDQFSFARRGIPAVLIWPGRAGRGAAATAAYMAAHYHRPSDDLRQPIQWDQAHRYADLLYRTVRAIGMAPARPRMVPQGTRGSST